MNNENALLQMAAIGFIAAIVAMIVFTAPSSQRHSRQAATETNIVTITNAVWETNQMKLIQVMMVYTNAPQFFPSGIMIKSSAEVLDQLCGATTTLPAGINK